MLLPNNVYIYGAIRLFTPFKNQTELGIRSCFPRWGLGKSPPPYTSVSVCARHALMQFKLHRIYWTKTKLSKFNPDLDIIVKDVDKLQQLFSILSGFAQQLFWTSIFKSTSFFLRFKILYCHYKYSKIRGHWTIPPSFTWSQP